MSNLATYKVPSLAELAADTDEAIKENQLMVLLNQEPPTKWLEKHPTIKVKDANGHSVPLLFLPITRVEYLLSRVFTKWWVEIKDVKIIANSVVTTVRLYVKNPMTGETMWNDGIGASPLQIKANSGGAIDFANMQTAAVQMAAPSSESYAIKDAAEKWGKLFGKDLNRKDVIDYSSLLKTGSSYEKADLFEMYNTLQSIESERNVKLLSSQDEANYHRIIGSEEQKSYKTLGKLLSDKIQEVSK